MMHMIRKRAYHLTILAAALLLAVTSFASAARMGPSDAERPELVAFLAMGGTFADICDDGQTHDHAEHCPFCHVTARGNPVAIAGQPWVIVQDGERVLTALAQSDQRRRSQRSARGPPRGV